MTDDERKALIAEANDWRAESPDDPNTEQVSERVVSLVGRLADALEASVQTPAVDREALARWFDPGAFEPFDPQADSAGLEPDDWMMPARRQYVEAERAKAQADALSEADSLIASGILQDVAEVKAEALEEAAVEIREQMIADELAGHMLTYSSELPQNSKIMLNGAQRFMERQLARAQQLREVRS